MSNHNHRRVWIGDKISYNFSGKIKKSNIKSIDLCRRQREKYGKAVPNITRKLLDRCYILLNNGNQIYGDQIILT